MCGIRKDSESHKETVSVIIPVRPEVSNPLCLESLEELDSRGLELEVIVARGRSPARQRNRAVAESKGDYLLFLDDDSVVPPYLLHLYLQSLRGDPGVAAIGGPAEPLSDGSSESRLGEIAMLLLGERWVIGSSAARYRRLGSLRDTDETELILCNLCVRRVAFDSLAGFDPTLSE